MAEAREARTEYDEAQVIEGYGCTCGFNRKEFTNHALAGRRDGKGVHKSLDRMNLHYASVRSAERWTKEREQICQEQVTEQRWSHSKERCGASGAKDNKHWGLLCHRPKNC